MRTAITFLIIAMVLMTTFGQAQNSAAAPVQGTSIPAKGSDETKMDPIKEAALRKMLIVTGMADAMEQAIDQTIDFCSKQNPSISPEFWTKLKAQQDINSVIDRMVPLYYKHYSLDYIKEINASYENPAVRHIIPVLPQLKEENLKLNEQLSLTIGSEVEKQFKAENVQKSH